MATSIRPLGARKNSRQPAPGTDPAALHVIRAPRFVSTRVIA